MNRVTKIFQPQLIVPKNAVVKNQDITSKGQKLMLSNGLIKPSGNGSYFILPLLQRSIEKLSSIIDNHMKEIDGQKVTMPTLTAADLWKKSGRFESARSELMVLNDRHDKLQILSPTHEESITSLISSISPISYRNFPLRIYQITSKFRDEMKPRFGLIRCKEFLMKDLYTFDIDLEAAKKTYEEVNDQYSKIFQQLQVPVEKILADTGVMGGKTSHEYHILTSIGEDQIVKCRNCSRAINKELDSKMICGQCQGSDVELHQGIEVAHSFVLEDRYSKVLKATFLSKEGKPVPLQMGCYGIGVTRLVAACVELLSLENEIRWPVALAPYKVCIISPKSGSKEESEVKHSSQEIYDLLESSCGALSGEIVVDDRETLTIGKRMKEVKNLGIPFIVVIGSKATEAEPKLEVHSLNDDVCQFLSLSDTLNFIANASK